MAAKIQRVDYYHCNVRDRPGAAYHLLADLAAGGVNLLAFTAVPVGADLVQLTLFPDDVDALARAAEKEGLSLTGPDKALLIRGDDELGALAEVHRKLYDQGVKVYASSGVTGGAGRFGYVIYVRPEEFPDAARTLGV